MSRECIVEGCVTRLSIYNPGEVCYAHSEEDPMGMIVRSMTEEEWAEWEAENPPEDWSEEDGTDGEVLLWDQDAISVAQAKLSPRDRESVERSLTRSRKLLEQLRKGE